MNKRAVPLIAALLVLGGCAPERTPAGSGTPSSANATTSRASSERTPKPPPVGQAAPDFSLADLDGDRVTLADARGRNAVLVFYRGHW